jgi:hypothetical protein
MYGSENPPENHPDYNKESALAEEIVGILSKYGMDEENTDKIYNIIYNWEKEREPKVDIDIENYL